MSQYSCPAVAAAGAAGSRSRQTECCPPQTTQEEPGEPALVAGGRADMVLVIEGEEAGPELRAATLFQRYQLLKAGNFIVPHDINRMVDLF